ncbi:hypothetical protein BDB00DRAFT_858615 [Zychaea mexicana]|uniref:uncharacterized protein n=1 Tax=Zychaea mexicana TaxID=64656 RepID=UPI0022FDC441|nr:uncharacterized protein BDB00DRAFT_858615 [Zychaea mexicana]KAI9479555.1 hypothetical protein BDB00DRAFT_858615 [Zychaea mexicana]
MQPTGQAGATAGDRRRKMSLTKLNDMCPVQSLVTDEIRTKNSVCAICLEELQEDDLVRVLPCGHGFCVACIDVWLTKKSCLCPICKYDCDPPEESATDGQEVEHEQQQQQHPRGSVDLGNPSATEPHETDRTPETAAATVADSSHSRPPHIAQEAPLIAPPSSSSSSSSSEPSTSSPAANTESSNNTATDRSTAIAQSSTSNIVADTSSEANNSQEKQQ